ncbi:serine hydrolase domain-containing protein [Roseivirga misakiensis]|uniref:Beta-lactamase-related domain-containing protein n=1 Tax=Roseivirga misakiensis TaxID=1563681 RepID=A0A1E5SZU9_9BACT|nr:serine hydrolase domain-containing protein [Roseivirga misakiensis]OEK04577.1 hypothetical protein BFP71_14020 [Roseivirga misakiensis]
MKNPIKISVLLLFWTLSAFSQTESQIDSIFSNWANNPNTPGGSAVIIHKGEVIYNKAFGLANIAENRPNTTNTAFQLAGMSKQFTAFATFLLADRGEIKLTDDIRKYLPEMRVYDHTITINHLLSSTSGLNDVWTLKSLMGWRPQDHFTHSDALRIISAQKDLGFIPGDDHSNTQTETVLLAEIVARVSGLSFAEFCNQEIFDPLGMDNTFVLDTIGMVIPDMATSYQQVENGYSEVQNVDTFIGAINVFSSSTDLSLWELNMLDPKIGSKAIFDQMNSAAVMNNGQTIDPPLGRHTLGQQFLHKERGILNIYQTGSIGGYTSSIFKFIDDEFTIIVLSNAGEPYTGYLGMFTCYLFLKDSFLNPAEIAFDVLETLDLSEQELSSYTGAYWDKLGVVGRDISLINDTLRYVRSAENSTALLPIAPHTFQMMSGGDEAIIFRFNVENEQKSIDLMIGDSAPILLEAYEPVDDREDYLHSFKGTFVCEELNTTYEFLEIDGQLVAQSIRNGNVSFTPVSQNLFEGSTWAFGSIKFELNESGQVTGFHLFTDYIRDLWFKKV